jgi:dTDP-4-dehydrorhamnose reductase
VPVKVLLLGSTGKLGAFLHRRWSGRLDLVAPRRAEVDLRDPAGLRDFLARSEFDLLVNCSALANPDQCEEAPEEARLVNADSPAVMAEACRARGARLVHFSTDYVLDGRFEGLKDEEAPAIPVNVYGRTKLAGEQAVTGTDDRALVCRVSWIFGTEPPGFCDTILARARARGKLEAIADKDSMPTSAARIAEWVEVLVARDDLGGLFHLTHTGEPQSWWSYGARVLEMACELGLLAEAVAIAPTRMDDVGIFKAPRPRHTAMRPRRLLEETGIAVGDWEAEVRAHLAERAEESR